MRSDFQTMFPIYIMMGPFLAIIEIASLVVLINNICDTDRSTAATKVYPKNYGIGAVKQFLCYPKGLTNILVTLIVIASVSLSNHATTSTSKLSEQKPNISGIRLLPPFHVHHVSWKNISQYNTSPHNNVLQYNLKPFNPRVSNNASHRNSIFIGIENAVKHHPTKREYFEILNSKLISQNDTQSKKLNKPYLQSVFKSTKIIQDLEMPKRRTEKTSDAMNMISSIFQEKSQVGISNIVKSDNELNIVNETHALISDSTNNKHLKFERHFNLTETSKNMSWHHVLPIWRKVMHNLATKMKTNENKEEETKKKSVIKTWKNTLLGMLAIILFASLFLQLSLLINTSTTNTVY